MTDLYGATSLPVASVVDAEAEAIADPARATVLAFCRAVIEAECETAWEALAPGEPLVRTAHLHDPRHEDLGSNTLPALFCFRGTQGKPQQYDDGTWGDETPIELLWVFPPAPHANQATRRGIRMGLSRALHKALGPLNGRHPSWVAVGDTDPYAATYGSSILTLGGFFSIGIETVREAEIKIDTGTGPVDLNGVLVTLACREDYEPGTVFSGSQTIIVQQRDGDGVDGFTQELALAPLDFSDAFDGAFS